jgi:serine/threonine-protein kinase
MASPASEGIQIGKYRVLRRLASGGMGEVFLARVDGPGGFEKTLVLKRVLKKLQGERRFIEMFLNEARVAAQLSHPNVVQIFELAELDGSYVIAMEYVEGLSLRALMSAAKGQHVTLSPALAAYVCAQALQGLHYAHLLRDDRGRVRGVVHRDVSPENILLGFSGAVKVADFGLARAAEAAVDRAPLGKASYMAPEQRLGTLIDARADLYGVGVVLSELLTGAPVDGLSRLPRLSDPTLEVIVGRALSPNPDGRYLSAAEMGAALEEYVRTTSDANATRLGDLVRTAAVKLGSQGADAPGSLTQLTIPGYVPEVQSSAPQAHLSDVVALPSSPDPPRITLPTGPPRPKRWRGWPVALVLLVVGAVSLFVFRPGQDLSVPVPVPSSVVTPPAAVAPPVSPAVEREPVAEKKPALTEPAAEKKPAPRRPGHVQVRVHPWAEVFWGGKSLGTTPLPPLELPSGRQVLTLQNRELNVTREVVVVVKPDAEVSVFENFLK